MFSRTNTIIVSVPRGYALDIYFMTYSGDLLVWRHCRKLEVDIFRVCEVLSKQTYIQTFNFIDNRYRRPGYMMGICDDVRYELEKVCINVKM